MRGDGRVYRRGNRYWIAYYFRGELVREPGGLDGRGAKTEEEARKTLKQRIREIHGERYIGPRAERLTVGEVLDSYKVHLKQKGAKALRSVVGQLRPVERFFALTRAVDLTTEKIRRFIDARLDEGKSASTVNRAIQATRAAFRLALKEERLTRIPYFPLLREDNARRGFFERDQFESVVANLPDPIADIALFAYFSGWRKGEVFGLRWSDVDRGADEILLRTSKNGEGRILPLEVGELREIIDRRWAAREYKTAAGVTALSEYVFHIRGRKLVDIKKSWSKACMIAGCPGMLFHDLRRTAVRDMIRGGVQQAVAMSITGHKTDSIFRRYNITSTDDKREALRRLAAYRASRSVQSNVVPIGKAEDRRW
jgi:integrase